jgi:hypothetical protein
MNIPSLAGGISITSNLEGQEDSRKPVLRLEPPDKSSPTREKVHKPILRHSQGVEHIGLHAGLSSIGYKVMGDWGLYVGPLTKINLLLGLEWKEQETALYRNLFIGPTVGYALLSTNHLYFNGLIGLLLTYVQYEEQKLKKKQSNFNVGALLGAEVELFLIYPLALVLSGGPMVFLLEDSYHRLDYWLSAGLSINF